MLCLTIVGVNVLFNSSAQSPSVSVITGNGILSGLATKQSSNASPGGSEVQFGSTDNPLGTSIKSSPTGPLSPISGWHVTFADDFNSQLGTSTGQDNYWYPSQSWNPNLNNNVNGDNGNETEVYNAKNVSISNGKLVLSANYQNNVAPATGDGSGSSQSNQVQRNYVSGIVTSTTTRTGYKGFTWTPGNGSTWAFEMVSQWPIDPDGNLWNAWWTSTQGGWLNERDFFEGLNTSGKLDSDWIYQTTCTLSPNCTGTKLQDFYTNLLTTGFDQSAAFHRYTYVINPDQSWSFYIDGTIQKWVGVNGVAPVRSGSNSPMLLILNYAFNKTTFNTGIRHFDIDSVAVYQDSAHAGQSINGGGIAPGTYISN